MTMFRRLLSIMALLVLAACGGAGGDGGSPFGGPVPGGDGGGSGGTPLATDVDLQLSSPTIPDTGATTVRATVTALDANRNALPGVAVSIAATNGAIVTITGTAGSVTDASGRIVAEVGVGSAPTNTDITVTAAAGGALRSAILKVVSSPAGITPASIEVLASSPSAATAGDLVQLRAFVKDSNNRALPSVAVSFSASTGTLSSVSSSTDTAGVATANFSAGADKSNREALITVSAGTVTSELMLPVSGTRLTLSGPSSLILGSTADFDIVVSDSKGNVVPGVAIAATSSLGNALTASAGSSTNTSGQVRFTYLASNAGTDDLQFSGAGASVSPTPAMVVSGEDFAFISPAPSAAVSVNTPQAVQVRLRRGGVPQAGQVINFAATGGDLSSPVATTNAEGIAQVTLTSASAGPLTVQASVPGTATSTTLPLIMVATQPSRLVLQVSPTALAPNIGTSTANQVQVVARVTDPDGNPVLGKTVNFTRVTDPSGGNLLQASATTDASGQATVAYRSGSESTANNGVVLRATVAGSSPEVFGEASLTVSQTALFIALGTGNVINNLDPQTYKKDWVVYVTDSNGVPVNGVSLTVKAIPTQYLTGRLSWQEPVWAYSAPISQCENEDANENGILDAGEDSNGDGVLWPGNVISVSPGLVQTSDGRATISLTYAESYAPWVRLKLTVSATVSGTESKTNAEFIVIGSSADFTDEKVPPSGVVSPFGLSPKAGAVCTLFP
jgi:hypothetical protein